MFVGRVSPLEVGLRQSRVLLEGILVILIAISKHCIHLEITGVYGGIIFVVFLPVFRKGLPFYGVCSGLVRRYSHGSMSVLIGQVLLRVILQSGSIIRDCVVYSIDIDNFTYSSKSNLHQYTLSEVNPRASVVRFLWSVLTLIDCLHSMPLNSFSVSTMARSLISVTISIEPFQGSV